MMAGRFKKWMRVLLVAVAVTTSLIIIICNVRLYSSVPNSSLNEEVAADVLPQLEFLGNSLRQGLAMTCRNCFRKGIFSVTNFTA
jgi:hypothetical protein